MKSALIIHLHFAPVTCIRARRLGLGSQILFDLRQHRRQLLLVIGFLRDLCRYDDLRLAVDHDLSVVGLHEAPLVRTIRHDPALRIGEVTLRLLLRNGLFRLRRHWVPTARLLPRPGFLLAPGSPLGFGFGLLLFRLCFGFRFQFCFRRLDLC